MISSRFDLILIFLFIDLGACSSSIISARVKAAMICKIYHAITFLSLAACTILSSVDLGLPPREVVSILTGGIALPSYVLSVVTIVGTQKKKHYVSRVNRDQEGSSSEGVSKDQQQNACRSHGKLYCVNSATEDESNIINKTSVLAYNPDRPSWLDYTSTKRPSKPLKCFKRCSSDPSFLSVGSSKDVDLTDEDHERTVFPYDKLVLISCLLHQNYHYRILHQGLR
nr:probable anion transporter 6, chloroplastic [Tanacetum cinerariifolium]